VAGIIARGRALRPDDLLLIVIGAVPGAVVAGRLGYRLVHPDAIAGGPATLLDPSIGGLDLAAGVVGGIATATLVIRLLGAPLGSWANLAALPLLVALGAGKLTMVLGGSGQGLPSDAAWATAYLGPGPWGSLAPALPSHPAQAYEGLATLALAAGLAVTVAAGAFGRGDGRLLLVGVAGWAFVRAIVTTVWRDPIATGPLPAAGWLALAIAAGASAILIAVSVRRSRDGRSTAATGTGSDEPSWPDPATRPPF
jgi:prolipoprotein diacylglyceryltransferase